MYVKNHVGCAIAYFGHGMCGHVVEQVVDPLACISVGLFCCVAMSESAMSIVGSTARA